MRTIKFRGKKTTNDVWVYGSLVYSNDLDAAIYFQKGTGGVKSMDWVYVKPETIGQFTCLRDINGKDIYEGDILKVNYADEESYLEVRFVRGVFAFLWNGDLDDEFPCNAPTHEWAKVIGNIHDNPKLINKLNYERKENLNLHVVGKLLR